MEIKTNLTKNKVNVFWRKELINSNVHLN